MYGKREIQRFYKIKKIYFDYLIKFGFSLDEINSDFAKSNIQEGNNAKLNDFIWYRLNLSLSKYPNDFNQQFLIYLAQKSFIIDTKSDTNLTYLNKILFETRKKLDYNVLFDNSGIMMQVVMLTKSGCCEFCAKDSQKVYDGREFYENVKLPHENCYCENGCACWYGLEAKRDDNGRLIFVDNLIQPNNKELLIKKEKAGTSIFSKLLKKLKLIK